MKRVPLEQALALPAMERLARDKHSSFLQALVNCGLGLKGLPGKMLF